LERINQGAFDRKNNLKSITFSEGIKSMGSAGISMCENLESVYFPSTFMSGMDISIRGLGGIISLCEKLTTITVSEDNENLCVYEGALYTKDMKTLVLFPSAARREIFQIPDGVEAVGDDAFYHNRYVKEVIMPDTVTYIGYWAFCNAASLEKINISENCEMIGQFAIQGTQITRLHIPASVTWIMSAAINGNLKLEEITVDENNPVYHSHEGVLCSKTVVCAYPPAKTAEYYEVEEGMSYIDMSAFYRATYLKEIVLPNSMQRIESGAFSDCYNLEKINLPNGISYMSTSIFSNNYQPRKIIIPYSMEELPEDVLSNATSATVQENVKQIGKQSLYHLKEIYFAGDLPQNIENILAVEENKELTIYYPYGNTTWEDAIAEYSNSNITWLPHTHEVDNEWIEDWPCTSEKEGQKSQRCRVCGAVVNVEIIEEIDHSQIEIRNVKEASCTEPGYTGDTYCAACDVRLKSGREIPEKGHQWSEGMVIKEAGCTETGKVSYTCTECKETKEEEIEAKGHGETEVRNEKEANCTEPGYSGDKYCVECNEKLEEGEVIPQKGHQWSEGMVTKKATYAQKGTRLYTCIVCGGTQEESIDMLEITQPQILSVENVARGVSVNWNKIKGAAGYRIYRKSGKSTWKRIAQVKKGSSTNYIDAKAKDGTTYTYTVSAFNGENESKYNQIGKTVIRLKAPKI